MIKLDLDAIRKALLSLLPPGDAFSRDPDSNQAKAFEPAAAMFQEIQHRDIDLLNEADPSTTFEMLGEWERAWGLPDPCTAAGTTIQERRAALVSKITGTGGQSITYYLGIAAALGYAGAEIEELRPSIVGVMRCGDNLGGGHDVRNYWRFLIPDPRVTYFRSGESQCGDLLGDIDRAEDLECLINRLKPAHTVVQFDYSGV